MFTTEKLLLERFLYTHRIHAQMEQFELKPEHLKLLKAMEQQWQECDAGAPSFNSKRPFGNSAVEQDIANLLGITREGEDGGLSEKQYTDLYKLYRGTQETLQIIISQVNEAIIKPGVYVTKDGKNWDYKGPSPQS